MVMMLMIITGNQAFAQEFEVPENYSFESKEDYTKYETDILASVDWLINSPLNKEMAKRKEVNTFLLAWAAGTSAVSISIDDQVSKYTDKNPELLMIFIAGWTKYSLENNHSKDLVQSQLAAYTSIIEVYKKGVAIERNKKMEKLIKIYDKGELEAWIKEHVEDSK